MPRTSLAVIVVLVLSACGGRSAPARPAPSPVVEDEPESEPDPPAGAHPCTADARCVDLPTRGGAQWVCTIPAQRELTGATDGAKTCEARWPDGALYCDTVVECPVREATATEAWISECLEHHCVLSTPSMPPAAR